MSLFSKIGGWFKSTAARVSAVFVKIRNARLARQWDRNRPAMQQEANIKAQSELAARQKLRADMEKSRSRVPLGSQWND